MDEFLYNKEMVCPVCSKMFNVTKVRLKGLKIASRDTDFCISYEGTNPLLYEAWVCENCGYAAQSDKFEKITDKAAKAVRENLTPKWKQRSFSGERNIDNALDAFKLVLLSLHARGAKSSEFAKVCLRIAWLYRFKQDEKEIEFLKFALRYYSETYEKERFPVDKMDEITCIYMLGELNRRVGNNEEAVKWFSRLIGSPEARRNPVLMEMAREQFYLVREKLES